ncbi:DUF507 family protein [bacterium]|nr:DUF507 family protein [bacterium]
MRLSEERIKYISDMILETLLNEEHIDLEIDEDRFQFILENRFIEILKIEDEIDEEAAAWMHTNKPYMDDGSNEFLVEIEKIKKDLAASKGYVLY